MASGKQNLEELQLAGAECGDRPCEVETPHAGELHTFLPDYRVEDALEARQPMLQCLRVVQAKVFDVEHAEALWLEGLHRLANRWSIASGKDALTNPHVQRRGPIASNEM